MKNIHLKSIVLLVSLMTGFSSAVYAEHGHSDRGDHGDRGNRGDHGYRHEKHDRGSGNGHDFRWDKRSSHDRQYPRTGIVVKDLSDRHHRIHYRDRDYFYSSGIWYEPSGLNFVVVKPPIGIVVPILPSYYSTVWLQDRPYYYSNNVYYVRRPDLNAYEVVSPPDDANEPELPQKADELFIYPRKGQNEEQQADDRYDCHRWGVEQTSYDPTRPSQNTSTTDSGRKRDEYQRAMKACLEGKGYSVR